MEGTEVAVPGASKGRVTRERPIGLVVSADADVCAAVQRRCGPGMQVYSAGSSASALALLKHLQTIDLVLVDAELVDAESDAAATETGAPEDKSPKTVAQRLLRALVPHGDPIRIVMSDDPVRLRAAGPRAPRWDAQLITTRPPAERSVLALVRSVRLRKY